MPGHRMTVDQPRIHRNAILAICCVVQGMVLLDVTIVNIALPSIQTGLHMSDTEQQWVINAYTLVFGGFLLLGGRAADLFGRRRVFLFGLTLFSAASFVGGLATSGPILIGARAFQGLGAAILAPASLSTLTTTFAEGPARTRALTWWSMTAATGGTLGTVMGGVLTDQLDWRWVLWVNVPIAIGVFVAALRYLHVPREDEPARPLDVPGAVTITAGLAILIYAIVTTDTHAWGSLHTLGLMALGIGLIIVFVVLEARSREPLVPLRIFRSRSLVGADITSFLLGGLVVGQIFFTSQFIQRVNGYSPLHAGLAMFDSDARRAVLLARVGADRRSCGAARDPDRRPADVRGRVGVAGPGRGRRQLRDPPRAADHDHHHRHRVLLRADDDVRDVGRAAARCGSRLGTAQQLTPGRRRPVPGDPGDDRP